MKISRRHLRKLIEGVLQESSPLDAIVQKQERMTQVIADLEEEAYHLEEMSEGGDNALVGSVSLAVEDFYDAMSRAKGALYKIRMAARK